MPSIKVHTTAEEEIEITPSYCYEQAARCLGAANQYQGVPPMTDAASEWRQLGDSIRYAKING